MKRRNLLALAAVAPLLAAAKPLLAATRITQQVKSDAHRDFVLVHGAFHGGWCWQKVADILRAQGNRVFTPTFTGLGDRSHLLNDNIDLNTFIQDVSAVIEWEELNNVVLVGHSFGGYVISGVADRMPERIGSLVYLDAPMGSNGMSVLDEAPEDVRNARLKAAISLSGTRAISAPSSTNFGVSNPDQVAWVDRRMTPMPLKSYKTPLVLKSPPGGDLPKLFIRCTHPALPNIEPAGLYARKHGWSYTEIATGHDAMVTKPEEVAKVLMAS